jgi:hypothetical protein
MVNIRPRVILFLLAVLVKLWLIWPAQISDATDDPHEYMLQILYPANGGLTYPPGTGLIGRFCYDLGLPFRLSLEISFLFAAAVLLRALFAWPWQSYLALGLFILTIFDPAPAELFSHLYSDQVWLIETMLGVSCLVLAFRREGHLDWNCLVLTLFFLGLSMITRSVSVPLLLALMVFALLALALLLAKFRSKHLKRSLDLLALTIPTLVLGIALIYLGICRYNVTHHGYTGISYIDSNEYKQFYLCLQSVGDPTGVKYFPIDERRRQLIAKAGPDSAWFIQQLDGNAVYQNAGLKNYGIYDIPAGWFHWAAFTAAMDPAKGDYMTAFSLFKSIEGEIATANRLGAIRVRAILPLPDCRLPIVAGALPDGARQTVRKIIHEPPPAAFDTRARRYDSPDFTKALTRPARPDLTAQVIAANAARDRIWQTLVRVYSCIYTRLVFGLFLLSLVVFLAALAWRWKQIDEFSLTFIARQFFPITFFVYFFWYALFDASGMPVTARYMILNHLLLLPLLVFYLLSAAQLHKSKRLQE